MRMLINLSILTFVLVAASSQCFALRDILVVTGKDAEELGIDVGADPAGPDAARLELEFKPEGKLKEFTHVELKIGEGDHALVISAELRATRSSSGSVVVSFTVGRAHLEKTILSVVMHSPGEAGDHTYELWMKDFVDLEKLR